MSRYDEEVRAHISPGSESILPSETRRGRDALAPCACVTPGVNSSMKSNGMADESPAGWRGASRRCVFPACPGVPSLVQGIRMPHSLQGGFLEAPAFLLSFWASGRPNSPFSPCGRKGWGDEGLTGVEFLASACVPSSVSAIRTPKLPLLPLWEKGAGGMRVQVGHHASYSTRPSCRANRTSGVWDIHIISTGV
jgi:hypothetical protein